MTDGTDRLYVRIQNRAQANALVGLWLRISDDLAFELPTMTDSQEDRWFFDLTEGALAWESGDAVELSLWESLPPGTTPLPQKLWTGSMAVAQGQQRSGSREVACGHRCDDH